MHKVLTQYPGIASRFLMIGEGGLYEEATAIQTVLGSCVSVTFLHTPTKIGAIFHALLPGWADFEKTPFPPNPYKYVDSASELPRSKLRSIKGIRPRTDSSNQE